MNRIVLVIVLILLVFTLINAYTAPSVNLLEFAQDKNNFGIGIGVLEQIDARRQVWNVFPLHFYIKGGERSTFLAFPVLSIVFKGGTNYGKPVNIYGAYSGDVVSVGGQVNVSGRVDGDIWVFNADVVLGAGASVSGNVVAFGGRVRGATQVEGTKLVVSDIQFPLVGVIIAPDPQSLFQIQGLHLYAVLFFALILFFLARFSRNGIVEMSQMVTGEWKHSMLFTFIALVTIPVVLILLISAKVGIILVPVIVTVLFAGAYMGYMAIAVRIGSVFLKKDTSSFSGIFFSGTLGFAVLNGLTILGFVFSLIPGAVFVFIRDILLTVGAIVSYLAIIYGLGISVARMKNKAA